jgi:hypothetical protein
MKTEYVLPESWLAAFNCPFCHVFSKQSWYYMQGSESKSGYGLQLNNNQFLISNCEHCHSPTIWLEDKMIFPIHSTAEPPNIDLPDDIKNDYEEARMIANQSPRGAAALLRLAIQKLCAHLGQPGKNINADIKAMVQTGLPPKVQEALDSVRLIGNNAVHPGEINFQDDLSIVNKLFKLVNFIANKMITEPKEIAEIYDKLPPDKIEEINKRDCKK